MLGNQIVNQKLKHVLDGQLTLELQRFVVHKCKMQLHFMGEKRAGYLKSSADLISKAKLVHI